MAGITNDGIASTERDSSTFSGTLILGATISGTALRGSLTGGYNDGNGAVYSVGVGSPITYGAKIQAGSAVTSAGSLAVVQFGAGFATNQYKLVLTGIDSSGTAFISGTVRASGCTIVGAPSLVYNWIAIGA